ncbi:MAG: V-type ATPase subunit [Thermoprotei archaeon]
MKSSALVYLITRAHGLYTHLLTQDAYKTLLKTKDLNNLVEYLFKSDYGPEISKIPSREINASTLSKVVYSILTSRFYHLITIAPSDVREFLKLYSERFMVENIKRILRAKHSLTKITNEMLIPIPREYALINFPAMIESATLQDSLELLKATKYYQILEWFPLYRKHNIVTILEGSLDKIYFERSWKAAEKLPDSRELKAVLGVEIDLRNISLIIDLRARDISPETVLSISFRPVKLKSEDINQMSKARLDAIPDILMRTHYQNLAQRLRETIESKKLEQIDHIITDELYNQIKIMMIRYPSSFSYVIGYLIMTEIETRNLIALITGKELGLQEEKIRETIHF